MIQLHEQVGAQLRAMGRCAMVGTLIGLMTTQAFAAGAPPVAAQPTAIPETSNVAAPAIDMVPTANLRLTATDNATGDANALPEAPNVQDESASLKMPAEMRAMMDDAAQQSQALTSPASTNNKKVQRPGMLVMGIAGVPLAVLGVMILSLKVGPKAAGERDGLGAAFLAPGAAMAGFGFYFAFHKTNQ